MEVEDGSPAREVVDRLMDAALVTVLGSGIYDADRTAPWQAGDGTVPNANELAVGRHAEAARTSRTSRSGSR